MNYDLLLDDEMKAFIERTYSCYPKRKDPPTIAQIRADYEVMCACFAAPYPEGLTCHDAQIAANGHNIPVRWYRPQHCRADSPVIIYFHGGGFVMGGLESHDSICADLAGGAGAEMMAVDYRLAPDYPFPAAFEDGMSAVQDFCATQPDRPFILAGDSAGAWLAARLSHALARPEARLLGQVLIYPTLGGAVTKGSYLTHAHAPMLTTKDMIWYSQQFLGTDKTEQQDSPLMQTDFRDLPPTVIFSAAYDPLCDDGPAYAARIRAAGGTVHCVVDDGLTHGHLRGRYEVQKIKDSFARMLVACRALIEQSWPYSD